MKKWTIGALTLVLTTTIMLGGTPFGLKQAEASHWKLGVYMVDVAGAGFIVRLPNHKWMVVDSGTEDEASNNAMFYMLDALNVTHIDYLVGTHHHIDHIGGHDNIIANYSVGEVLFPKYAPTTSASYTRMKDAADLRNIPIRKVEKGDQMFPTETVNGLTLKSWAVSPQTSGQFEDDEPVDQPAWLANAYSLVFYVKYNQKGVLFMGDSMNPTTDDIMALPNPVENINLYVASHHGDNYNGNSDEFLNYIDPQYAFIASKTDDKTEFKTRLRSHNIAYWSTYHNGNLNMKTDGYTWTAGETAEWSP